MWAHFGNAVSSCLLEDDRNTKGISVTSRFDDYCAHGLGLILCLLTKAKTRSGTLTLWCCLFEMKKCCLFWATFLIVFGWICECLDPKFVLCVYLKFPSLKIRSNNYPNNSQTSFVFHNIDMLFLYNGSSTSIQLMGSAPHACIYNAMLIFHVSAAPPIFWGRQMVLAYWARRNGATAAKSTRLSIRTNDSGF